MRHTVKRGDCVASIAFANGHFPDTVWDHPDNAELRAKRKSPHVLYEGDVVVVPPLRDKSVVCPTGLVHTFKRRGVPEKLKLRFTLFGKPRPKLAYELIVDGVSRKGQTDGDGKLDEWIPPDAKAGTLLVGEESRAEEIHLAFGELDPVETETGVRSRLRALGLHDDRDSQIALRLAVRRFQARHGMNATGEVDDVVRAKLVELFGQ